MDCTYGLQAHPIKNDHRFCQDIHDILMMRNHEWEVSFLDQCGLLLS